MQSTHKINKSKTAIVVNGIPTVVTHRESRGCEWITGDRERVIGIECLCDEQQNIIERLLQCDSGYRYTAGIGDDDLWIAEYCTAASDANRACGVRATARTGERCGAIRRCTGTGRERIGLVDRERDGYISHERAN